MFSMLCVRWFQLVTVLLLILPVTTAWAEGLGIEAGSDSRQFLVSGMTPGGDAVWFSVYRGNAKSR